MRWTVLVLIAATMATEVVLWVRAFGAHRRSAGMRGAAVAATEHVLGPRLWSLIAAEFAMVCSLARWILRRQDVPRGTTAFSYHRQAAPVMWVMVGLIAAETLALHLIVPWPMVRLVLVILSLYSLLWVLGFIAGFVVHPHLLSPDTLTLRHGPRVRVAIPVSSVAGIGIREGELPGLRSVRYTPASAPGGEHVLHIAHAGRTNTVISLSTPLPGGSPTDNEPVTQIHAWVDDPRALRLRLPVMP